jgi:Fe-S cluster assembly iron-binding protein IscA
MLTVTEAAGDKLASLIANAQAPKGVAIRAVAQENGITLQLDKAQPGDETFEHEGKTVLVADEEASKQLTGKTFDVVKTAEGSDLTLR